MEKKSHNEPECYHDIWASCSFKWNVSSRVYVIFISKKIKPVSIFCISCYLLLEPDSEKGLICICHKKVRKYGKAGGVVFCCDLHMELCFGYITIDNKTQK